MMIEIKGKDIVWSYLGALLSMAANIVMIPFLVYYLDENLLGLWYVFCSIGAMTALFDFGFATTFARNITYCFSGAKKLCKENIKKTFPNIKIVGSHNGFFDLNNCNDIIEDIKKSNPWGLFIAMGCPRQENFIVNYIDELNCNFYMPVGGSFDVFAGKVNRAPKWMLSLGLEWLYRVLKEPWRIKRLGVIPKFLLRVLKNN